MLGSQIGAFSENLRCRNSISNLDFVVESSLAGMQGLEKENYIPGCTDKGVLRVGLVGFAKQGPPSCNLVKRRVVDGETAFMILILVMDIRWSTVRFSLGP